MNDASQSRRITRALTDPRPGAFLRARLVGVAALLAAAATGGACQTVVGDACQVQADCGTKLYCEQSFTDGYCTLRACEQTGCPEEGVCVTFYQSLPPRAGDAGLTPSSSAVSFCMRACDGDADCRDGYRCVQDFGPHPFCNDARGETPGGGAGS